jgi:hypothetical protein
VKLPHHFTARFGRPTNAVQEHGTMGTKAKPSGVGSADGFAVCGFTLIGRLRPDERDFSADECWRKHYASNHEGKRHTDKSENKTVAEVLAIGSFVQALVDVRLVEQ